MSHRRRALYLVVGFGGMLALLIGVSNAIVVLGERGEATADVAKLPHAQTAIVLGAEVQADGRMSAMLRDRVQRAAQLWHAGKVDRVLVSGDHGRWAYDEPTTMRRALERDGVPARVIFTDHAGFNTWATMVRARKVFGVRDAIVVTQGFHMARALYLAHRAGLDDVRGLTSDQGGGYGGRKRDTAIREVAARVKAVADGARQTKVLLGPRIPITGDARLSWGPSAPAGTPPAGAPAQP